MKNVGLFMPSAARIRVVRDEAAGLVVPVVCLQCDSPLCKNACPVGAIVTNSFGVLTVNNELCVGCGDCVTACVYGGIVLEPVTRKAAKCDLCGGTPACVKACEYDAIQLVEAHPESLQRRALGFASAIREYGLVREE